jgi:predicted RNA-binding protein associated with RNAse of E/G family
MTAVRVECRKWPDSPHWEFDAVRLGVDGHGTWLGIERGTLLASPTRAFHAVADHVTLVPHDAWSLATFYGEDPLLDSVRPFDLYVDIATPAVWHDDGLVRAVDLDLDVIRGTTGRVWVDDEDEFASHRVSLGYPDDVVERAVSSAQDVMAQVQAGAPPYDGTHLAWITRLRRMRR